MRFRDFLWPPRRAQNVKHCLGISMLRPVSCRPLGRKLLEIIENGAVSGTAFYRLWCDSDEIPWISGKPENRFWFGNKLTRLKNVSLQCRGMLGSYENWTAPSSGFYWSRCDFREIHGFQEIANGGGRVRANANLSIHCNLFGDFPRVLGDEVFQSRTLFYRTRLISLKSLKWWILKHFPETKPPFSNMISPFPMRFSEIGTCPSD